MLQRTKQRACCPTLVIAAEHSLAPGELMVELCVGLAAWPFPISGDLVVFVLMATRPQRTGEQEVLTHLGLQSWLHSICPAEQVKKRS